MVPQRDVTGDRPRLDRDHVDTGSRPRHRRPIGQLTALADDPQRAAQTPDLVPIHGLLGQAEVPPRSPSDLDGDDRAGRSRIDREQIDLGTFDTHLVTEDPPALQGQSIGDESLRGITAELVRGSHQGTVPRGTHFGLHRDSPPAAPAFDGSRAV